MIDEQNMQQEQEPEQTNPPVGAQEGDAQEAESPMAATEDASEAMPQEPASKESGISGTMPDVSQAIKNDPGVLKAMAAFQRFSGYSPDKAVQMMADPRYKVDPSLIPKIVQLLGGQKSLDDMAHQRKLQQLKAEAQQKGEEKLAQNKADRLAKKQEEEEDMIPAAQALLDGNFTSIKDLLPSRALNRIHFFNVIQKLAKDQGKEYNAKDVELKFDVLKKFTTGKDADQIQSFNTFLGHVGEAWDANQDWSRANSPLLNKPLSWIAQNASNDPTYTAFITALQPIKDEYMTFLQNNHALTEQDKKSAEALLNPNSTPQQIMTALQTMSGAAGVRLDKLNEKWKRVMHTDFPDLLDNDSQRVAETIGSPVLSQMIKGKQSGGFVTGGNQAGGTAGKKIGEQPQQQIVPKGMIPGRDAQGNIVGYKDPTTGEVHMF